MELLVCKNCGKLFNYIRGERICPVCQKSLEEKFVEVKNYIKDNPKADIKTISTEMEVTIKQLHKWVREERLTFSEDSPVGIACELCGKSIRTGRFCDNCKAELSSGLEAAAARPRKVEEQIVKKKRDNKMRFLE